MNASSETIFIATRGSPLALAQANFILALCKKEFPQLGFDLKIIKTTGDKLQSASMARIDSTLPRGLFTKEIEEALVSREADLAVHSLKDLPTILPEGLKLGATPKRADVRDVLICRSAKLKVKDLPVGGTVATSSTRRRAQLLKLRPDLNIVTIRGNVGTRLQKLSEQPELDGIILAAAGLERLQFNIDPEGSLRGKNIPVGLQATFLELDEMLPCVGQAALGIEIRTNDERLEKICARLNDTTTWHCVAAERDFLRAMGGGCQSPVGAHAEVVGDRIRMCVVSFLNGTGQHAEATCALSQSSELGPKLAAQLKSL